MRAHAEAALKQSQSALASLEVQVSDIVTDFRDERGKLQSRAQAELEARTLVGRRARPLYAPLNLFGRVRCGGLELYWQEVHRHRLTKRPVYKYLRVTADGHGDLRLILSRACDFESDLVRATELEARRLRDQWSRWSQIRRACMHALQMVDRPKTKTEPAAKVIEWVPSSQNAA